MGGAGRGAERLESDRQLVQRVLAGNREAYATLVERYQHAVFAVALKVIGDRDAAEDAAQNSFVSAYTNLNRLHDANAFGAWLLVIARREALSVARSRRRTIPLDDDQDASASIPDGLVEDEKLNELMNALGRLAGHEQQVLMLRYFQSQPVATIAAITGRSVGTVTKQISRALARLREQLGGTGS
jgi:RNA polymerase sigma-70 factor (ECF subfamily)